MSCKNCQYMSDELARTVASLKAQMAAMEEAIKMLRSEDKPCTGTLVHSEYTSCAKHDR